MAVTTQIKTHNHSQHATNVALSLNTDANRAEAENFVRQRFLKIHNADITNFMPYLVTLTKSDLQACVGIRPATERLFVEQYLDMPVESAHPALNIPREQIAEIGNLVSRNPHATLQLFVIIAKALHNAGIKELVFCATKQVAKILKRAGADLYPIVEADGTRMGDSLSEWGTYYDTNPTIMRLNVNSINELINNSAILTKISEKNVYEIANIAQEFGA